MTNKEYQDKRDALIPFAEGYANKRCGKQPKGNREEWNVQWNRAFHGRMDELAKQQGLTK